MPNAVVKASSSGKEDDFLPRSKEARAINSLKHLPFWNQYESKENAAEKSDALTEMQTETTYMCEVLEKIPSENSRELSQEDRRTASADLSELEAGIILIRS
jgi:hypothetical protein